MCGIFAYIGQNLNSQDLVLTGLRTLEYRGYDSWGIASVSSDKKISVIKHIGKIPQNQIRFKNQSTVAVGHTRWATHGGVTDTNAHPHLDCKHELALIHNGIIENYSSLKTKLLRKGHQFISETDSEIAVHLIEEYLKKFNFEKSVIRAFKQFTGLNAIIVLNAKSGQIIAAKNGSPLIIGKGKSENYLASDAHALLPYTKEFYFMEDNEIVLIDNNNIKVINLSDEKVKKVNLVKVDWKNNQEDIGKFKNFMLKEIYDQPKVLEYILNHQDSNIKHFANLISDSYGTYFVGCGSAAYACLAGTYIFSKVAGLHVNYSAASEFGYLVDFLTPKSLVIGLSQSGETIDLIDALKKASVKQTTIASFVNVLGSTLYRMSSEKILLNAGLEKAVVSTKAFTSKIAHLILIAYSLSANIKQGKNHLEKSIVAVNKILEPSYQSKIKNLVKFLVQNEHIYIIGRGASYPIALETALKIKEASYIHAEGFAAGELKHGVIALIEKNTTCIAFVPNDETYSDTLSGVMEMRARGGFMIGIGSKNHEIFDKYLEIDDCGIASIIPSVIVGQLLGYYLAEARGLDPDKPRNLAKSVTVK